MPIVVVDTNGARHPSKISVTATPTTRVQVSADQARQVIFDPDITVLMANTPGRTTR
jgi:hypothetical protein